MKRSFPYIRGVLFSVGLGVAAMDSGCDGTPNDVSASKTPAAAPSSGLVTLSAEESSRAGLVVESVIRSDFRTYRDFPGIVQPDQHNMAEITTLVRGRVVDVYADLGQEVKANTPLAILYSSELGLAQSAYLKARARLHVAEQSYARAKFFLEEKVITLPSKGKVFISVRTQDRPQAAELAKGFHDLGFAVLATRGTGQAIHDSGTPVTIVNKVTEGRPNIVDMIKNSEVSLIINVVDDKRAVKDSYSIRAEALTRRVAYFTTLAGARAACVGMGHSQELQVYSLQSLHQDMQ